jgi:hypothetical protein
LQNFHPFTTTQEHLLAKPNYSFEKRQKELAKKKKQEEKLQQKLAKKQQTDENSEGETAVPEDVPST